MNKKKEFITFLDNLKGHEYDSLIESVKKGFIIYTEAAENMSLSDEQAKIIKEELELYATDKKEISSFAIYSPTDPDFQATPYETKEDMGIEIDLDGIVKQLSDKTLEPFDIAGETLHQKVLAKETKNLKEKFYDSRIHLYVDKSLNALIVSNYKIVKTVDEGKLFIDRFVKELEIIKEIYK